MVDRRPASGSVTHGHALLRTQRDDNPPVRAQAREAGQSKTGLRCFFGTHAMAIAHPTLARWPA
jgi:hypothetical protein